MGDFVASTAVVASPTVWLPTAVNAVTGNQTPVDSWVTDRVNTAATAWGSLIGYDHQATLAGENGWHAWEEDGVAAATESVANIGTFFIPVAGWAGGAAKAATVGARVGSLAGRAATTVADFAIPGGSWLARGGIRAGELVVGGFRTSIRGLDGLDRLPTPSSKKVPATMHHPVLDAHFPRLEQPETIDASVETVNADGWAADTGRYGNNCHYVVNAVELRARGYDVVASPTVHSLRYDPNTGQPIDGFEGRYTEAISQDWLQPDGSPRSFDSLGDFAGTRAEALDAATKDWPVGARGFISGAWKNGGAHIFSVVKTESGVRLVDGQVADGDVSGYLDEMHFGPELPATHKSWDIQIMRVDDLVPTEDVVHAAHPNTPAERKLTEAWGRAGDGTGHFADSLALPEKRIRQELAANDRWQARNDQLIARYQAIEADPSRSDAERARARDWAAILAEQNEALERGRMQFLEELADASTNRPGLNRIGVGGLMLTEEEQERIAGSVERGPGSGGQ